MRSIPLLTGGALLALLLAACGGGGSGGGAPAPPPGPPATGTINSGSVLIVSGRSAGAAMQSGGFGDITNFVGLTSFSANDPRDTGTGGAAKPAGWYVRSQVPVGPETTSCTVSGTVTVSGDIANPLTVTPGDFLDYRWDDCDNGIGQVVDGFIGMTFTDFEGNLLAGQILLGVSLVVENFRITEGPDLNVMTGDLTLTIDSRDQPTTVITSVGSSLSIADGTATDTVTDFSSTVSEDNSLAPSGFTTALTGTVTSSTFTGTVTYDTTEAFESSGNGYPHSGEMLIWGSGGATIRIIAMSEADIRIEADYDGDGAMDATIDTSWAALLGD